MQHSLALPSRSAPSPPVRPWSSGCTSSQQATTGSRDRRAAMSTILCMPASGAGSPTHPFRSAGRSSGSRISLVAAIVTMTIISSCSPRFGHNKFPSPPSPFFFLVSLTCVHKLDALSLVLEAERLPTVLLAVILTRRDRRRKGSDMRPPDIAGAIVPDVFIGRPEGPAIGRIEHRCAVITYPETKGEKAAARSRDRGGEVARVIEGADPHRQILAARRLHPSQAQVAPAVLIHGRHLDRHAHTGIDHALLEQCRHATRHVDLVVQALGIDEPIRRGAGGHRRQQVPFVVLDLGGRRVWKDGDAATGLIGLAGVLVWGDRQRRVREDRRAAEVVGQLCDTDGATACIRTVCPDEPFYAAP